jgi:hypothetical protein
MATKRALCLLGADDRNRMKSQPARPLDRHHRNVANAIADSVLITGIQRIVRCVTVET